MLFAFMDGMSWVFAYGAYMDDYKPYWITSCNGHRMTHRRDHVWNQLTKMARLVGSEL